MSEEAKISTEDTTQEIVRETGIWSETDLDNFFEHIYLNL